LRSSSGLTTYDFISTGVDMCNKLQIWGREVFFMEEYMELGVPCLWIFNCKQRAITGEDMAWTEVGYNKALQQLQR